VRAALAAGCCALCAFCALAAAGAGATAVGQWSRQSTPNPPGSFESELFGVSCASPSACIAVGYGAQGVVHHLLAERYEGGRWSLAHPVEPPGAVTAELVGVSCPAAGACTAVGNYRNRAGPDTDDRRALGRPALVDRAHASTRAAPTRTRRSTRAPSSAASPARRRGRAVAVGD